MGCHLGIVGRFETDTQIFKFSSCIEVVGELPVVHKRQFRVNIGNEGMGKIDILDAFGSQTNMANAMGTSADLYFVDRC
jgi:hypothetical protein